jgi:hypothetical protein
VYRDDHDGIVKVTQQFPMQIVACVNEARGEGGSAFTISSHSTA